MNKTLVKTSFLVFAGALAASQIFASTDTPSASKATPDQIIQKLTTYEITGRIQDIDRDNGTVTVLMADGTLCDVNVSEKTAYSVMSTSNVTRDRFSSLEKDKYVSITVDSDLNAKSFVIYKN